jgi:putative NADH-flavin reductase
MKLVVFGATGRIGTQVVQRATAAGHQVIAVTRTPKAAFALDEHVTMVAGDVFEPDSLHGPLAGADAVVFAVGSAGRGPAIVRSMGISAVVKAMRANGVSRLVAVSPTAAFISPHATLARKITLRYFVHKLYRNPFNDVERMEDELSYAEDLAWSVVRATALRDTPASGRYQVVLERQLRREQPVSVADLADYLIERAADKTESHDTVAITGI